MNPVTVYLSLGGNLGDRAANLRAAIRTLPKAGVEVQKVSSFYETEPVGYLEQPWFLNCVVQGTTSRAPRGLLDAFRAMEMVFHSKKEFRNGPRILDIDILLYGDETIDTRELQVPHPRMLQRKFVLVPLAEIAPEVSHAAWDGLTVRVALEHLRDDSEVRKLGG